MKKKKKKNSCIVDELLSALARDAFKAVQGAWKATNYLVMVGLGGSVRKSIASVWFGPFSIRPLYASWTRS